MVTKAALQKFKFEDCDSSTVHSRTKIDPIVQNESDYECLTPHCAAGMPSMSTFLLFAASSEGGDKYQRDSKEADVKTAPQRDNAKTVSKRASKNIENNPSKEKFEVKELNKKCEIKESSKKCEIKELNKKCESIEADKKKKSAVLSQFDTFEEIMSVAGESSILERHANMRSSKETRDRAHNLTSDVSLAGTTTSMSVSKQSVRSTSSAFSLRKGLGKSSPLKKKRVFGRLGKLLHKDNDEALVEKDSPDKLYQNMLRRHEERTARLLELL